MATSKQPTGQSGQSGQPGQPTPARAVPPSLPLSSGGQAKLIQFIKNCWMDFPHESVRARLEICDRMYARSQATNPNREERIRNSQGMKPISVPIIQPQIDSLHSKLVDIFATGYPMFSYVAAPENAEAIESMNALSSEHERVSGYAGETIIWLKDACKYNLHAMEVEWTGTKQAIFANPGLSDAQSTHAQVTQEDYYYNSMSRLNPYNCAWDMIVPISQVHKKGEFAFHNRRVSRVELKQIVESLPSKYTMNAEKAYQSAYDNSLNLIYEPSILPEYKAEQGSRRMEGQDWNAFFGVEAERTNTRAFKQSYILTTASVRMTPSDLGISASSPNTLRIYKFLIVNMQHIVAFWEQDAAHDSFTMVMGQPIDEGQGMQSQSLVERLAPVQQLITQLHISRIADLARSIADRGFYDPMLVDPKQMNNPNPSAKIPILPLAYGQLNKLTPWQPMEYRNPSAQNLMMEAQLVAKYGEDIAGLNPIQRGSYIKGNRTLGEFETVAGNAEARTLVIAILIEAQSMVTIKEILKTNLLQYQGPAEVFDRNTKKVVKVQPSTLRQIRFDFEVADGLRPVSMFTNPDMLLAALQFISSSPQFQLEYDTVGLFAWAFQTKGAKDLGSFRRSKEQQQEYINQQAAMSMAGSVQAPQPGQPGQPPQG